MEAVIEKLNELIPRIVIAAVLETLHYFLAGVHCVPLGTECIWVYLCKRAIFIKFKKVTERSCKSCFATPFENYTK